MTPESALTKLSYVLSKEEWDLAMRRKMLQTNLVGEMTVLDLSKKRNKNFIVEHSEDEDKDLIMAVAKQLKASINFNATKNSSVKLCLEKDFLF